MKYFQTYSAVQNPHRHAKELLQTPLIIWECAFNKCSLPLA